jgi:hypothetical protein
MNPNESKVTYANDALHGKLNKGVCHTLWPCHFTLKSIIMQKKELWQFKYFTMQKYNLKLKSSNKNQNPSRHHNSISFNTSPKYIIFQKSSYKNRPIITT